ncbi:MAG: DUF523 domain-containing protein [Acidimicrobiia bacterium]|nr:DUF523 domain-containing protein [Acidimicrobiia bacterium]
MDGAQQAAAAPTPVIVSACLLGVDCTYRAGNEARRALVEALGGAAVVPVCPEVMGGLGIPRPRAEIEGGDGEAVLEGAARVATQDGTDVTESFLAGAVAVVRVAELSGARLAVLKARSPACGPCGVYDGTHTRVRNARGAGVAAAALRRAGLEVVDEELVRCGLLRLRNKPHPAGG